jgi:choloylglycine hydrolase
MKTRLKNALIGLITCCIGLSPVFACTSFQLIAKDGSKVYARTMEFQFPLGSELVVLPRQSKFLATGPNNKNGASWTSKYAVVGLNGFGKPLIIDGMNEKGMAGGILYFPDHAIYSNPNAVDPEKAMAPWEFMSWALMNFATVAEVKKALPQIAVITIKQPDLDVVPPFHYVLHDATGAVLVIEPINGKLVATDNPFGVMTNSPPFDWHINNLGNYVKLNPMEPDPIKATGAGFLGMPGDSTSPSRFIRALTYSATVIPANNPDENVRLAEHILHNFDIPRGSIRTTINGKTFLEETQWSVISDLQNKRFYFSTYDHQPLRMVDFSQIDLNTKSPTIIPINQKYNIEKIVVK